MNHTTQGPFSQDLPFPSAAKSRAFANSHNLKLEYDSTFEHLKLPRTLKRIIVGDLLIAFSRCCLRAGLVCHLMRNLNRHRETRFKVMCPKKNARFDQHSSSIDRLMEWKKDDDPSNPTLAPAARIPQFAIKTRAHRQTYLTWMKLYNSNYKRLVNGPVRKYLAAKKELEERTYEAHARGDMGRYHTIMWRRFYAGKLLRPMMWWEERVPKLAIQSYEEMVQDLNHAIIERVEGGEEYMRTILWRDSP
ncbi:hypothetical protein BJX99DRAFT_127276 [Aspergillus californicus]